MREFDPNDSSDVPLAVTARQAFRALAAMFGLAMMLAGIYFAFQLFGLV